MINRTKIPQKIVDEVILQSRRRCAFCFGLHGDTSIKKGQIAHINRDRNNNDIENLAFLCLEHHEDYDSRPSQTKAFTEGELKQYKIELKNWLFKSRDNTVSKLSFKLSLTRKEESLFREEIINGNILQELHDALKKYTIALDNEPDNYRRIHKSAKVLFAAVAYSHCGGMINEQKVIKEIFEINTDIELDDIVDIGFHRAINDRSAVTNKIIFPFPFFLTPYRKRDWGVLPYAWQTNFAILIHKDNSFYRDVSKISSKMSLNIPISIRKVTLDLLKNLILNTQLKKGDIVWVHGYIQYEILFEIAKKETNNRLSEAIIKCSFPVDSINLAIQRLQNECNHDSLFILDTAEIQRVCQFISNDYCVIVVDHEIEIPVGIGFSLPCLPFLLLNGEWKRILKLTKQIYKPYSEEFEQLGIRFDNTEI